MKFNKWTVGLAAIGVVSLASAARADEKMSQVQTALSNTTISGYVDVAAQWNPGTDSGPSGANIPDYAFAKNDGFSLNAVDIALNKPMDESPWAAGYHVEFMAVQIGPDALTSRLPQVGSPRQHYVPISVKLTFPCAPRWATALIGKSACLTPSSATNPPVPLNPNYTRSYGYTIEPTTHTGILATYKVCDALSMSAGVADSSNVGIFAPSAINGTSTYESQKTYMGSIVLTAPDSFGAMKGATLTMACYQ